jgi:hypothetical protein
MMKSNPLRNANSKSDHVPARTRHIRALKILAHKNEHLDQINIALDEHVKIYKSFGSLKESQPKLSSITSISYSAGLRSQCEDQVKQAMKSFVVQIIVKASAPL